MNTEQLISGNYVGQITLNGMDANGKLSPGSPQIITVNLVVQSPCTISPPSSSALSFSAVQGASANPATQTVMFTAWGGCEWPLSWKASISPTVNWLKLTQPNNSIGGNGQSSSIGVTANITSLAAGTYNTTVTIAASDASGVAVQGSSATLHGDPHRPPATVSSLGAFSSYTGLLAGPGTGNLDPEHGGAERERHVCASSHLASLHEQFLARADSNYQARIVALAVRSGSLLRL